MLQSRIHAATSAPKKEFDYRFGKAAIVLFSCYDHSQNQTHARPTKDRLRPDLFIKASLLLGNQTVSLIGTADANGCHVSR